MPAEQLPFLAVDPYPDLRRRRGSPLREQVGHLHLAEAGGRRQFHPAVEAGMPEAVTPVDQFDVEELGAGPVRAALGVERRRPHGCQQHGGAHPGRRPHLPTDGLPVLLAPRLDAVVGGQAVGVEPLRHLQVGRLDGGGDRRHRQQEACDLVAPVGDRDHQFGGGQRDVDPDAVPAEVGRAGGPVGGTQEVGQQPRLGGDVGVVVFAPAGHVDGDETDVEGGGASQATWNESVWPSQPVRPSRGAVGCQSGVTFAMEWVSRTCMVPQ